jgi:hypothetical protein
VIFVKQTCRVVNSPAVIYEVFKGKIDKEISKPDMTTKNNVSSTLVLNIGKLFNRTGAFPKTSEKKKPKAEFFSKNSLGTWKESEERKNVFQCKFDESSDSLDLLLSDDDFNGTSGPTVQKNVHSDEWKRNLDGNVGIATSFRVF